MPTAPAAAARPATRGATAIATRTAAKKMNSSGTPANANADTRINRPAPRAAIRPVCAEHDGLLDVGRARGAGDEIGGARQLAAFGTRQRESILHRGHDAVRLNDGDVRFRQETGR